MVISFFYFGFFVLSLIAALTDFLFYKIPNILIIMILCGTGIKIFLEHSSVDFYLTGLIFMTTLLSGYLLYAFKIMGAGDAKFLSASVLWIAPQEVIDYLILVAVSGGILAACYIFWSSKIDLWRSKLIECFQKTPSFSKCGIIGKYLHTTFVPANAHNMWSKILIPYGISIFTGNLIFIYFYFTQRGFQ